MKTRKARETRQVTSIQPTFTTQKISIFNSYEELEVGTHNGVIMIQLTIQFTETRKSNNRTSSPNTQGRKSHVVFADTHENFRLPWQQTQTERNTFS